MKQGSRKYRQAMNKMVRDHSYMVVTIGIITAEAQSSAVVISGTSYISNNNNLFKIRDIGHVYATMEENVFKADGSMFFPPKQTGYEQLLYDVACISEDIHGAITVSFDKAYDIKGLTFDFGEYYPTSFEIYTNGELFKTYDNEGSNFICTDNFDKTKTFTIKPLGFVNGDNKRLRINQMLMGVGIIFQNEDISTASYTDMVSFTSEELPQLDLSLTVFDRYNRFNVDDSNSFINFLEAGQSIYTRFGMELEDGSVEWVEMPKTYLSEWSSDNMMVTFTATDRIALFEQNYEDGNYVHERSLYSDALDIVTFLGLEPDEYIIDESLKNIVVRNPLPSASCSELLQMIANAGRCKFTQSVDGIVRLTANFENIIEPTDLVVKTDTQADWSKPDNVRVGAKETYVDMTKNFFSADGSMFFMPKEGGNYLDTGFVSREVANDNGEFVVNPNITMRLPASYTYFGVSVYFGGNAPEQIRITTYDEFGEEIDSIDADVFDNRFGISYNFFAFQEMKFEILKGSPNDRVLIDKIEFGNITDYRLLKQDMKSNPIGTVEKKTQSVSVRIFTYEEEIDEETGDVSYKQVDDEVYFTKILNPIGTCVTFENELVSDESHAEDIAEWLGNWYANNISYQVEYRGEPRIDASDYIFMDSDVLNNLQVEVESHTLNFNGSLSGTLNLRRATNMINA